VSFHHSVLLQDALALLEPRAGGRYVDGTLGDGGHALGVLERSAPDGELLGLDRDPAALIRAGERLAPYASRCALRCFRSSQLAMALQEQGWPTADGVLLDFGLSTPQLDDAARGFSLLRDGPLDMRFDQRQEQSAADLVNQADEAELARIIRRFGEDRSARRIARAIVAARPLSGTAALASVVDQALGGRRGRATHPATRTFQALRIAVNQELDEVRDAIHAALDAVGPGGRVVAISFHSLEDRIVKRAFAAATGDGAQRDPYGNPVEPPRFRKLTRRAVKGEDRDPHPRARSARLRAVQRLPVPARVAGSVTSPPNSPVEAPRRS
jgi:16S rRNA (cytosine1402-N4)-methyltransferase